MTSCHDSPLISTASGSVYIISMNQQRNLHKKFKITWLQWMQS
jgi:hypothetical protein